MLFLTLFYTSKLISRLPPEGEIQCEICGKELTFKIPATVRLDHCHHCRRIRGILCHSCNAHFSESRESIHIHYASGLHPSLYLYGVDLYVGQNRNHQAAPFAKETMECTSCNYYRTLYFDTMPDDDSSSADPISSEEEEQDDDL